MSNELETVLDDAIALYKRLADFIQKLEAVRDGTRVDAVQSLHANTIPLESTPTAPDVSGAVAAMQDAMNAAAHSPESAAQRDAPQPAKPKAAK